METNEPAPKNDWKERELGGLYKKVTQSGQTILKGNIGGQRVIIMTNKYKTQDNHPDYRVYKDTYEPTGATAKPQPVAAAKAPVKRPMPKPETVATDDDAAF